MNATVADATHPVQTQLEAYNARDIDSFMRWWSDECLYYAFPDTLLASGADAIRERHIERFREPDLRGTLLHRLSVGNMVIDHEIVRRTFPEGVGEIDVVCIYEVENGQIAKAWFKMGEKRLLDL